MGDYLTDYQKELEVNLRKRVDDFSSAYPEASYQDYLNEFKDEIVDALTLFGYHYEQTVQVVDPRTPQYMNSQYKDSKNIIIQLVVNKIPNKSAMGYFYQSVVVKDLVGYTFEDWDKSLQEVTAFFEAQK